MLRISFKVTPEQVEPVLKALNKHGIVTVAVKAIDEPNPPALVITPEGDAVGRGLKEFLEARGVPEPPKQEPIGEMWDKIKEAAVAKDFPLATESKFFPRNFDRTGEAHNKHEFGGGKKLKEVDGTTLCLDIFRTLPYKTLLTTQEVEAEFAKFDFKKGSASTYLSALVRDGKLIRPEMGKYYMPDPQR